MAAVAQGGGGKAPGSTAIRRCTAQKGYAVIDLDRAVCFRKAGQCQDACLCYSVADDAAIGRERSDGRSSASCRSGWQIRKSRAAKADIHLTENVRIARNCVDGIKTTVRICAYLGP